MTKLKALRVWIGKKIIGNSKIGMAQSVITPEMREKSLQIRKENAKLKLLQRQAETQDKFEKLAKLIEKEKTGGMEEYLLKEVLPIFLAKLKAENGVSLPSPTNNSNWQETKQVEEVNLTPEQIKSLVEQNPKLVSGAKVSNDAAIQEFLVQNMPNISQKSIQEIIVEVRK